VDDHAALEAAISVGEAVVPLFVADPALLDPAGPNRRRYLAGSLRALDEELGAMLVLRRGDPRTVVASFAAEVGASVVAATADFGPYGAARDREVAATLARAGRELRLLDSPYLAAPGTLRSAAGTPFRVYTAFRRALDTHGWPTPVAPPARPVRFVSAPSDVTLEELEVPTTPRAPLRWWEGLPIGPAPSLPAAGPAAARQRLARFSAGPLPRYAEDRDRPALAGTSRLSADLHFGALHPRSIVAACGSGAGAQRLRDELAWRDFYADLLWHHPDSARAPLQAFGAHLRWDDGEQARERFAAWACGRTGYPLVDAGMRQLLAEGWMHNRVRMVTASFLVKDLHIDWRHGARWFMWHLIDGDLASNQHGWQWVAGTGSDAAPFHRVLNPERQRERFDPDGEYVRRYLGGDPPPPAEPARNRSDGLRLEASPPPGPPPLVDHARERIETLSRYEQARRLLAAERRRQPAS
jgi:deoxyribodipyrimidine photo-lyase